MRFWSFLSSNTGIQTVADKFQSSKKRLRVEMHAQPSFFLPAPQGITSSHLVIIRGESYHLPFLLIQGSGAELLPPCKPVEVSQCLFTCLRSQLLSQNPQCVYVCDTFNTNERHPFLKMSSVMQEAVLNTSHSKPLPSCLTQSQDSVRDNLE